MRNRCHLCVLNMLNDCVLSHEWRRRRNHHHHHHQRHTILEIRLQNRPLYLCDYYTCIHGNIILLLLWLLFDSLNVCTVCNKIFRRNFLDAVKCIIFRLKNGSNVHKQAEGKKTVTNNKVCLKTTCERACKNERAQTHTQKQTNTAQNNETLHSFEIASFGFNLAFCKCATAFYLRYRIKIKRKNRFFSLSYIFMRTQARQSGKETEKRRYIDCVILFVFNDTEFTWCYTMIWYVCIFFCVFTLGFCFWRHNRASQLLVIIIKQTASNFLFSFSFWFTEIQNMNAKPFLSLFTFFFYYVKQSYCCGLIDTFIWVWFWFHCAYTRKNMISCECVRSARISLWHK